VDAAIGWILGDGDGDGDGFVDYHRRGGTGLANQGWKDSWDAIRFADGTLAQPPIAVCEVQGYTYAAYLARAHFADEAGDTATATRYRRRADELKAAFNRDFWIEGPDGGHVALGLDRDKRPIDAVTSNMGHCLWTGILDRDKAGAVARRLLADDMFTGWGIRTLSSSTPGYDPLSYHCGSVWPHDTALITSGLMRYGFVDESLALVSGLLRAAAFQQSRLPELFSGLSSGEVPFPVSYPSSCSPQAWAAAAPLLCLRTLLRFEPSVPSGSVAIDPVLPEGINRLAVHGIPLAGSRVSVRVEDREARVEGLPAGVRHAPRREP
jgi:glycogen debranching enzyme